MLHGSSCPSPYESFCIAHHLIPYAKCYCLRILLSTEPAADPALGFCGLLLNGTIKGINILHCLFLGVCFVLLELSFGLGGFGAGFVYL
jgi:hypothetical protein